MDEPLSALDTYLRSHIEKRLVEVLARYQGVTLFITHKLEEAYRLCPNLLVLSEGRILAHDTREAIFARPPSYAVARVTECKNFSRARPVGDGSVEALDWGCQLQGERTDSPRSHAFGHPRPPPSVCADAGEVQIPFQVG
jgi:molybdate transport system permease protein